MMYITIKINILIITLLALLGSFMLVLPTSALEKPNADVQWGCATNERVLSDTFGCPDNVDIVTGPWLLSGWQAYHTRWIDKFDLPVNANKTPYMISYIIAGKARADQGLQDCDLSALSICTDGANYIRQNIASIQDEYRRSFALLAQAHGDNPVYIHMEPDFYLYHRSSLQKNPLTLSEAHTYMNSFTSIIREQLPQAKIVMDVSTWNQNLSSWHSGFTNIDYGGVVGKNFNANQNPDGKTYEQVQTQSGLELIVNTAHTFGGSFNPYNTTWENRNHGVHAVIQPPTNNSAYSTFLATSLVRVINQTYYPIRTFKQ